MTTANQLLKWLKDKLPKREVTPEIRRQIKAEFPGYHFNGCERHLPGFLIGAHCQYQRVNEYILGREARFGREL